MWFKHVINNCSYKFDYFDDRFFFQVFFLNTSHRTYFTGQFWILCKKIEPHIVENNLVIDCYLLFLLSTEASKSWWLVTLVKDCKCLAMRLLFLFLHLWGLFWDGLVPTNMSLTKISRYVSFHVARFGNLLLCKANNISLTKNKKKIN